MARDSTGLRPFPRSRRGSMHPFLPCPLARLVLAAWMLTAVAFLSAPAPTAPPATAPPCPGPYGPTTVEKVSEVLRRVHGYLESSTPSRFVRRVSGEPIV